MKKLLIIDSNSILNRAFYGIKFLSSSNGVPTNAIYGFLNIFLKLIGDEKPDYVCAAFDVKAPTFRHERYKEYKAQRKPMPEGLVQQMPLARELMTCMNIPVLELAGYEADDIIGTVSALCENEGVKCMIATGDKDDLQLASENTNVILTITKQGVNETVIYDDKAVFEKYGVTPAEFIDVKALMGDASDNIPGVAGIGEKTALKLIAEKHSIEEIYRSPEDSGAKGAMLKRLIEGKESAFLSKELATINRQVPIDFEFEQCVFSGFPDSDGKLYEFLKRLELNSTIKKLGLVAAKTQKEAEIDYFADMEISKDINDLKGADCVFMLLEFSGKSLSGAAFRYKNKAVVLKVGLNMTQKELENAIAPILEDESVKKIAYDIKEAYVKLDGIIDIRNIDSDVAIAAYLVEPSRSDYDISGVAYDLLGVVVGSESISSGQMSLIEEEETDIELAKRAFIMEPVWEELSKKIKEYGQEELYCSVEMPLIRVLASMQTEGFFVDKQELEGFGAMLNTDAERLTEEIYELAGERFNINSPKQLGVILFEKLSLPVVKKTKNGYSTNAEVLEKLAGQHPIIERILEYRQITKLKSTYCDGMTELIDKNGRIHSIFNQTVTVTGRISSTEPNLQNIPVRTELGRNLRKMFTASSEDYILVDADYSQIELRVLAHIANDEVMREAFINNVDIHAVTASQVFDVPLDEVTKEQRSAAKAVNFGIVYGIGDFSLAQDLKIPMKQAKEYIANYLGKYTGVAKYMEEIKAEARKNGYVKTLMNRIRFIPEIHSSSYNIRSFGERVALNTPVQGTAADIIKLAMVRVYERLKRENLKSKLILQVHDELIVEALKSEEEQVKKILKEEMENAMDLNVPLEIDMSSGKRWYDAK